MQEAIDGKASEVSGIAFFVEKGTLYIELRSGRRLVYPHIRIAAPGYEPMTYLDRDGVRRTVIRDRPRIVYGNRGETGLYGGSITENIVQGMARDILVNVMRKLEDAGYQIVMHCHDSITLMVEDTAAEAAQEDLRAAWAEVPSWAQGLATDAETACGRTLAES